MERHSQSLTLRGLTSAGVRWDRAKQAFQRAIFIGNDSDPRSLMKPDGRRRRIVINVSTLDLGVALEGARMLGRPRMRSAAQDFHEWESLVNRESSICVHVRRGDVVAEPAVRSSRGVLSLGYWRDALNSAVGHVRRSNGEVQVLVFSDDIAVAMGIIKEAVGPSATVIAAPDRSPAWHFCALSSASNLVISNSGFSWWAAIFGEVHSKVRVFAPDEQAPGHPARLSSQWRPLRAQWEI